jgi:hypothetical protein
MGQEWVNKKKKEGGQEEREGENGRKIGRIRKRKK